MADLKRSAKTMNLAGPSSKKANAVWRVLETLLWGFALFMVIPPVPSDVGQRYSATLALMLGGAAFCAHIGLKIWWKEETIFFGVIKIAIYGVLVVGVNMRVFS